MNSNMILYHGSQQIVAKPQYGIGKPYNDYGVGFYCTENMELAKEWACPIKKDGYANQYILRTEGLNVLHLTKAPHHILHWMAVLLKNRWFDINNTIGYNAREYIIEHFMPDLKNIDVVIGYRADDSYFSFAEDFVNNAISVRDLNMAMRLGTLGEQVVLTSSKAFSQIAYTGYEIADYQTYYFKRKQRDEKARFDYKERKKNLKVLREDLFVLDIIREELQYDDPRLQSHIFE